MMIIIAIFTVKTEFIEDFRAFEKRAALIMQDYAGVIERTVVVNHNNDSDRLKEIHVVSFPNARAFSAYQQDIRIAAIAYLREKSVIQTELHIGETGPIYAAS